MHANAGNSYLFSLSYPFLCALFCLFDISVSGSPCTPEQSISDTSERTQTLDYIIQSESIVVYSGVAPHLVMLLKFF